MPTQLLLHIADSPDLLKKRTSVLARFWNIVATDSLSAWARFCDNDFDMALICHSVPVSNYEWLKKHIHERSPSTPVLRVMPQVTQINPQFSTAGELVTDDPQALMDTITHSLHLERGLRVMKKGA